VGLGTRGLALEACSRWFSGSVPTKARGKAEAVTWRRLNRLAGFSVDNGNALLLFYNGGV
jgi:hypothetical protein